MDDKTFCGPWFLAGHVDDVTDICINGAWETIKKGTLQFTNQGYFTASNAYNSVLIGKTYVIVAARYDKKE